MTRGFKKWNLSNWLHWEGGGSKSRETRVCATAGSVSKPEVCAKAGSVSEEAVEPDSLPRPQSQKYAKGA